MNRSERFGAVSGWVFAVAAGLSLCPLKFANAGSGTTTYGYDDAGRLTLVTSSTGLKRSYQLDAAGNRVAVVGMPLAPSGLSGFGGKEQAILSWTTSFDATSYNVYKASATGLEAAPPVQTGITGNNTTVAGLNDATSYFFTITAVNVVGESEYSNEVMVTTLSPPLAPSGLTASAGNSQITLNWSTSSGALSYNVYQSSSAETEVAPAVRTGITGTSVTISGLSIGTPYFFKVSAVNAIGESGLSHEISATPIPPPAAPANLLAGAGNTQATLTWSASAGATSYNVYQGTAAGGEGPTPIQAGLTGTTALVPNLTNGAQYFFTVRALNAAGQSGVSNEASATPGVPPTVPTTLVAAPQGQPCSVLANPDPINLNWTASTGASSYSVLMGTASGAESLTPVATGIVGNSVPIISGITTGTTYYFEVFAVNAYGQSIASNEANSTAIKVLPTCHQ